jgi:hypothetical protein
MLMMMMLLLMDDSDTQNGQELKNCHKDLCIPLHAAQRSGLRTKNSEGLGLQVLYFDKNITKK